MHNQWSARRRGFIFLIILAALIVLVGIPTFFSLRDKPVCNNGKQDGDETGVDCGGSCQLLCTPEILPIITRGDARLLKIAESTYEVVVLLENPNVDGEVVRAPYVFSIYSGTAREPAKTFSGQTYIARGSTFALFTGPFTLEGAGPYRAAFKWGDLTWEKSNKTKSIIAVEDMNLIIASTSAPRLEASLENRTQKDERNIEAIAVLSDTAGNIMAAGKTFVDSLSASQTVPIVFSWPEAFATQPVSIRIIPHVLPDKSYLR